MVSIIIGWYLGPQTFENLETNKIKLSVSEGTNIFPKGNVSDEYFRITERLVKNERTLIPFIFDQTVLKEKTYTARYKASE